MSTDIAAVQGTDNIATSTSLTAQAPVHAGLLDDPIASAIHDAFLIGWSLTELRSRIQIELLKIAPDATSSLPQQGTQPTSNNPAMPQSSPAPVQPAPGQEDTLLQEVEKLTQSALLKVFKSEANPSTGLASEWRSLFSRIASIQNKRFPNSTTDGTSYDPPPDPELSYLQPKYADKGIISLNNNTLTQFRLYDVTRKTLNCLTLLYTDPEETLIPNVISDYQRQLVRSILNPNGQISPDQNGAGQPGSLAQIEPANNADDALGSQKSPLSSDDRNLALTQLSSSVISLLNAWDEYLRENYYTAGSLPNNELELVAYEGGRSLATVSWCITIKVEPLEKALYALQKSTSPSPVADALSTQLKQAWMDTFKERDIIHIQHQIAALKTALDDAYYRVNKQTRPTPQDAVLVRPDLNLPSNALKAVIKSLDYWQSGIGWLVEQDSDLAKNGKPTEFWMQSESLRIALIQQADVWQSLVLCQQNLQSFSVQSVTQKILNNFMQNFQSFARQSLSQTAQASTQDIAATTNSIKKEVFSESRPIWLVALAAIIVVLGVLFALLYLIPGLADSLKGIFSGLLVVAAGALGGGSIYARNKSSAVTSTAAGQQTSQGNGNAPATAPSGTDLLDRFSSFLGSFGSTIMSDFDRGYQQILIEFDHLNHNVSVAFPFIEFFIMTSLSFTKEIKDDYDFLTTVIWTEEERSQEIERIAYAAFGPLGAIVGSQLGSQLLSGQGNNAQPPKPANSTAKAP
jgi:hypothetical protein